MKLFLFTLSYFICAATSYGQVGSSYNQIAVEFTKAKGKIAVKVVVKSSSADPSFVKFLEENISQSIKDVKRLRKGKYIAMAKYIVMKHGTVADVVCAYDPGFGLCKIVVRALKKGPKWLPAKQIRTKDSIPGH